MPLLLPATLLGLLAVALAIGVAIVCARRRRGRAAGTLPAAPARVAGGADPPVNPVRARVAVAAFEAAREARTELNRLTFPDADFARPASGLHAEVIRLVEAALEGAVQQRNYFPRRPLLIPKLLAAINDPASSQARWAEIVLRDPVLAGEVLRLANSAWFRVTTDPVEDMPKAVRLLGADGLRSVVASSVLQPVFRCPAGPFQSFPEITWHQAMLSGVGAQYLARHTGDADPAVGHLLGLVVSLGRIVVFRLALDTYRSQGTVAPRAEVLVQLLDSHADRAAQQVVSTWDLSPEFGAAIAEQSAAQHSLPGSGLGRVLAYGRLAGTLATLAQHGRQRAETATVILREAGLGTHLAEGLWARLAGPARPAS